MAADLASLKSSYDVVVVGARAAGAATAMLLARRGASVLLVEQGGYGADTLSTLALMRAGVVQLSRWGLLDRIRASGTPRVEKTTFHYDGTPLLVVNASDIDLQGSAEDVEALLAVIRRHRKGTQHYVPLGTRT